MGELIGNVQNTLDKANTELAALKDDGKYELMQKLLDKDSSEYGEFFSSPVKVTTENVYEAVNYGTAVAAFLYNSCFMGWRSSPYSHLSSIS